MYNNQILEFQGQKSHRFQFDESYELLQKQQIKTNQNQKWNKH
jgi:hypothetical protein